VTPLISSGAFGVLGGWMSASFRFPARHLGGGSVPCVREADQVGESKAAGALGSWVDGVLNQMGVAPLEGLGTAV
jgi:hypothetical protein